MTTYFAAVERVSRDDGTISKTSGILVDFAVESEDRQFLRAISEEFSRVYQWPADEIVVTCVSVLKP